MGQARRRNNNTSIITERCENECRQPLLLRFPDDERNKRRRALLALGGVESFLGEEREEELVFCGAVCEFGVFARARRAMVLREARYSSFLFSRFLRN